MVLFTSVLQIHLKVPTLDIFSAALKVVPSPASALCSCTSRCATPLGQTGLTLDAWLARDPPGSGTKAQLCRKRLQFPLSCVTNTLLCLPPKPQPHGTQRSAGIFPLTEKHIKREALQSGRGRRAWAAAPIPPMNESLLNGTCRFLQYKHKQRKVTLFFFTFFLAMTFEFPPGTSLLNVLLLGTCWCSTLWCYLKSNGSSKLAECLFQTQ